MDVETLKAYETEASRFSQLYLSVQPLEMQRLMQTYFHAGKATADIGCGSGRDTAWLVQQGFPAIGYDFSPAMLREAREVHPGISFQEATLPELASVADGSFDNVLCAAVLMHVGREHLITAVLSLGRILRPGGRLILSYRRSLVDGEREPDGRLYTDIPPGKLSLLLEASGLQVIQTLSQVDAYRPNLQWSVILAEKGPLEVARGLERVQSVLVQDKKDATYKFALIRAMCAISRTQPHIVRWEGGSVFVPLWSIAIQWLIYYWPFLTRPDSAFVAQKRGEKPGSMKQIAFRRVIGELVTEFGAGGIYALLRDLDEYPLHYRSVLKRIADTIRDGPVHYSGTGARLFRHRGTAVRTAVVEEQFGWVEVPEPIWLDISRFNHWIEDSLILRWAQLTADMNKGTTVADFVPLLLAGVTDERDTALVRALVQPQQELHECVWSGASLKTGFDVDHVIPYSAWGNNDLWNMLPALPKLNNQKRDSLPTQNLLLKRRDAVIDYWRLYSAYIPQSFERQVSRALGRAVGTHNWEVVAFAGLQEAVERAAATRGLSRWEP